MSESSGRIVRFARSCDSPSSSERTTTTMFEAPAAMLVAFSLYLTVMPSFAARLLMPASRFTAFLVVPVYRLTCNHK